MQAPAQLGKYEVRREIGRGAMGVVYEAFDPSIGRAVAIKVFRPGTSISAAADEMDARFRREAQVAGRLSHPNLVVVHEFGEATVEGTVVPYIVMELVRGTDLKALLASRGRLTLTEIARVMNDLLAALQHAHERGVVHRDIKPGNLMLCDDDGRLKVADFGIAKTADSELTRTGELLGTAAYMSPEQVTGAPVDLRTDIYAAGVILYQLLTGEPPFSGGSTTSVIQKILNQEPVAPSVLNVTIPRALDAVVQQAMAKKPAARFASAAAFARAITAAIDASGNDGTTIVSAPPVAAAKPRRARTAAIIGAGAAIVALLGYAAFAWLGPHGGTGRGDAGVAPRAVPAASMPAIRAVPNDSERAVALAMPAASVAAAPAAPAVVASAGPAMAASAAPHAVASAAPRAIASAPRPKAVAPASVRPATVASAGAPNPAKATANANAAPTYASPPMPVEVKPLPATAMPQPAPPPTRVAVTASAPARPASSATATASAAKAAAPSSASATTNPVLASCEAKARAGDAVCQTQLGTMYRNGDGVARNFAEALRWYRLAADQGLADAQNRLGAMLAAGQGTAPDHNEAARWYRKAADQGHAAAQNNLGRCYERGEGVTGSAVLASQWYRKSADQGHAAAEYNLGRLYQTGSGVFKDVDKARALFQSAAGHGNSPAAYALGVMYENGTGVPQSNAQAAYWYRIAAAKPDPNLSTASQQRIKSFLAAHP